MNKDKQQLEQFYKDRQWNEKQQAIREAIARNPELLNLLEEDYIFSLDVEEDIMTRKASEALWRRIAVSLRLRKKTAYYVVAAATVGLLLITGLLLVVVNPSRQPAAALAANWQQLDNTSDTISQHVLPDGSIVRLQPRSTIRFSAGFTDTVRGIYLNGTAAFKVAQNVSKPFIVYSGNIATRALGTAFIVRQKPDSSIQVKLIEGRVMVSSLTTKTESYYLQPGDYVYMDMQGHRIPGTIAHRSPQDASAPGHITDQSHTRQDREPEVARQFNNAPLPQVLDWLQENNDITISYNRRLMMPVHFTGLLNTSTQSVEKILETIALLNNLQLKTDSTGTYYLKQ